MTAIDPLLFKIETVRKRLIEIGDAKGYTNPESVSLSQELDRLLNLYEKAKS
ncbi:Spo0E family sporulation regulatory protein-aspartic acid phosphatase [Virgibacillus sediminis]|uniref:Spo0E family sporulation regulatory protein-aspartic acid phosphatase n=1 Tax=Virgibacillus sediminis TaxID=202260 RepID=A0ABV7ABM2_9BACI